MNARKYRRVARQAAFGARDALTRWLYGVDRAAAGSLAPAPQPGPGGLLRVHLGCGSVLLDGWFNVDERWFPHVHLVGSVDSLTALPDASAETVYASHVLEHVPHRATVATLREWRRVLAPAGRLYVAVPDLDRIVDRYVDSGRKVDQILGPLMGEQDYPANTHRAVFNAASLTALLEEAGFCGVQPFQADEILGSERWDNAKHPLSLNLSARKP